jgi:hypothetical protein
MSGNKGGTTSIQWCIPQYMIGDLLGVLKKGKHMSVPDCLRPLTSGIEGSELKYAI